jgi:hypothetical protein
VSSIKFKNLGPLPNTAVAAVEAVLILSPGGWVGGCSGVEIKLNSVQLQLQLPAGTELGKK